MQIYDKEEHINKLIENNRVTCDSTIVLGSKVDIPKMLVEASANPCKGACLAAIADTTEDVMPFSSILVTDLWNKNDDVFTTREISQSYSTAKYKPINWMHRGSEDRENETIGVMINSELLQGSISDLSLVKDNTSDSLFVDKTSGNLHIKQDGLIWEAYFPSYASSIKKGIEDKDLYVSMECFFDDFGYALRKDENDSDTIFIERNASNSYMSDKLAAYGGSGRTRYNGKEYQIGRWLREIVFSGQGVVDDPANRKGSEILSIIFANENTENGTSESAQKPHIVYKEIEKNKKVLTMSDFEQKYNDSIEENKKLQEELDNISQAFVAASQEKKDKKHKQVLAKAKEYEKELSEAKEAIVDATNVIEGFSEVIEEKEYYRGYAEKAEAILGEMRSQEKGVARLNEMKELVGENVYTSHDVNELKDMSSEVYEGLKKAISKVTNTILGDEPVYDHAEMQKPEEEKCLPCEAARKRREKEAKKNTGNIIKNQTEALNGLKEARINKDEFSGIVRASNRDPLSDAKNLIKHTLKKK